MLQMFLDILSSETKDFPIFDSFDELCCFSRQGWKLIRKSNQLIAWCYWFLVFFNQRKIIIFEPNLCFIFIIILYNFKGASVDERKNAMAYAHKYASELTNPFVPITVLQEGAETKEFDELF